VRNLRLQLSETKVTVVEVIPGLIKTTMTLKAKKVGIPPEELALEIVTNSDKETIVLKGARLAWILNKFISRFVQNKIMQGD